MALSTKDGVSSLQIKEKITPASKWIDFWNFYPDASCGENVHDGGRTVVLAEGTTGIVILLQQHKAHEGTAYSEYRPGLDHLSFRVDGLADIEAWAEHLDGLGVPRRDILVEEWGSVLVFRDPDRIQLEIFCDPPPGTPVG